MSNIIIQHVTLENFMEPIVNEEIYIERIQMYNAQQQIIAVVMRWFKNNTIHSWMPLYQTFQSAFVSEQELESAWQKANHTLEDLTAYINQKYGTCIHRGIIDIGDAKPIPGHRWTIGES